MTAMPWVARWAEMIPAHGRVLDLACGNGRHAVLLAGLGHPVEAVDIDLALSEPVRATPGVSWRQHDLEAQAWPFESGAYQGVVVTNYLHRPLFPLLIEALSPGGVLIYATFSMGQEVYGRPRNPQHLLMPGELLEAVRGRMRVVAYEDVLEAGEPPARVQRLCAIKN
ncbi:MAG: class I SAM-dependent methyltransferase [Hydrogenophilaceae bacterium]